MKNKEIKTVVPKLRFPEFQKTENWSIEPLENLYSFEITNSLTRDDLNYSNGSVKNIHYGDIHTKFSTLFDITKEIVPYINDSLLPKKIKCYCKEGDMIFADASEDLEDVGKSIEIINLNDEKVVAGLHTLFARPKGNKLIVGFGGHLFLSKYLRLQIQREAQGAKIYGISSKRLSKVKIYYPKSKEEQQKIADCLSSIDNLITSTVKKIEVLKAHKKGLVQQLFPAKGKKVPVIRFPEFQDAGEWKEKTIQTIGEVVTGNTPSKNEKEFWGGNFVWITAQDFKDKYIYDSTLKLTEKGRKKLKVIPQNSILVTCIASIGLNGINKIECATNQQINSVICYPDYDYEFVYYAISYNNDRLKSLAGQTAVPIISKSVFENFVILITEKKKEQQKIADCLSSLDDLITALTQKLEALKTHKKGLMQQLFPDMTE